VAIDQQRKRHRSFRRQRSSTREGHSVHHVRLLLVRIPAGRMSRSAAALRHALCDCARRIKSSALRTRACWIVGDVCLSVRASPGLRDAESSSSLRPGVSRPRRSRLWLVLAPERAEAARHCRLAVGRGRARDDDDVLLGGGWKRSRSASESVLYSPRTRGAVQSRQTRLRIIGNRSANGQP